MGLHLEKGLGSKMKRRKMMIEGRGVKGREMLEGKKGRGDGIWQGVKRRKKDGGQESKEKEVRWKGDEEEEGSGRS